MERRLYNLEKKLFYELMKVVFYGEVINKYVENGVVEEVFCDEIILIDGCFVFYFFYYVIIREDK